MKTRTTVLVLLSLCALALPCLAETQPAAMPAVDSVTAAPVPADVHDFLATLSGDPTNAPEIQGLQPGPNFLSTTCTSSSQCPTGQLCCYPCGIDGCSFVCMNPVRGHCPFFP
jgi:hypothetical protein